MENNLFENDVNRRLICEKVFGSNKIDFEIDELVSVDKYSLKNSIMSYQVKSDDIDGSSARKIAEEHLIDNIVKEIASELSRFGKIIIKDIYCLHMYKAIDPITYMPVLAWKIECVKNMNMI